MLEFLYTNGGLIAPVILAAMGLAQAIVNLTPTPKDDDFFGKVYPWIEKLAGLWSDAAKEHPGEREQTVEAILEEAREVGRAETRAEYEAALSAEGEKAPVL